MNSEYSRNSLHIKTMYQYDHHTNIPWNITQYQPKKNYIDPHQKTLKQKYASQKKGQKTRMYITKRGYYLDYQMKVAKSIPSANQYKQQDFWDAQKKKKKGDKQKIDFKVKKNTYLQQIQTQQKNHKIPGVTTYHLIPTQKQIQNKLKILRQKKKRDPGNKRFYYQDTQYLSNTTPGCGNYNPRLTVKKFKLNKTTKDFWIDKHKKIQISLKKRRLTQTSPATYSPMHMQFNTFQKTQTKSLNKKGKNRTGFGTDQKFAYLRQLKNKNKKKQLSPSPASYNTFIQWPSKPTGKVKKLSNHKSNWANRISHGFSQSIYN